MSTRIGTLLRLVAVFAVTAGFTAAAAPVTPSTMMANVFRLSEAGAVLEICFRSAAFESVPAERSAKLRELAERMAAVVRAIGTHYKDDTLVPTYEATRDRIAGESRLRLHVKNHYEYCGERLATEMEKYVAENEELVVGYFKRGAPKAQQRRTPDPPPVPSKN